MLYTALGRDPFKSNIKVTTEAGEVHSHPPRPQLLVKVDMNMASARP